MDVLTYGLFFVSLYFEVFLLVAFLERVYARGAKAAPLEANLPTVAVIVPCHNEQEGIADTIHSLLALKYPKDKLEVLVIDDGSTDRTKEIAEGIAGVRVYSKENGGKHSAMNFALNKTAADFIGCLDADSTVDPDALMHIIPVFSDSRVAAVTPGLLIKEPSTWLQHLQKVEYRISIFNRYIFSALGSAYVTPGPFSIFRAAKIRDLGGWRHGHSTEDLEMALRLQDQGHIIANAPRALVYTGTPLTLKELIRQRVRWTYGFIRNAFDYRHMFASRKFGNLGLIVLPAAVFSVATSIFFFVHAIWRLADMGMQEYTRMTLTESFVPSLQFSFFYMNTSAMWFLVWVATALVLALISVGSWISTGSRRLPAGTPLFVILYWCIVPIWVTSAVFRAAFRTGVRWK